MFDSKSINLSKVPRVLNFPYKVSLLGYINDNPEMKNFCAVFPDRLEINIRLDGSSDSEMLLENRKYVCKSPHVVVKKPNTEYEFRYLPERRVFYVCYDSALLADFEKLGLFKDVQAWEIERNAAVEFLLKKIIGSLNRSRSAGVADSIDINCFALLNELMLQRVNNSENMKNDERELIMQAESFLHFNVNESVDFDELAENLGMSRSTFFRHWKIYFNETPAEHFRNLKLDESLRLLGLRRHKISEIAKILHFSSSAYFCSVFRKRFGMTPQQYAIGSVRNKS